MAEGALQFNNVAMSSTSFFIMDGADTASYVSFDLSALNAARTITMPNTDVDLGNLAASSLPSSSLTTGTAGINLSTTVGGLSISVPSGTGVSIRIENALQADFVANQLTLGAPNTGYVITHASTGVDQDFAITQTGAVDSSIILNSAGTGTDAVLLVTTAGGIKLNAFNALDMQLNATSQVNLSADGTMTLKPNNPYTITHAANSAADNLTLSQTGAFDSGILLTSTGTSAQAISMTSTAGGVSISSDSTALGGGITLNKWTTLYGVSYTSSSTGAATLWTADLGNDRAVYNIKASICALDNTASTYAAFEANALFQHDGTTTLSKVGNTVKSGIGTGVGAIAKLANWDIGTSGDNPAITVTPAVANVVRWKGQVTIHKTV